MPDVQAHQDDCLTAEDVRQRAQAVEMKRRQFFGRPQVVYIKSAPKVIVKRPSDQEMFEIVAQQNGLSVLELSDAIRFIKCHDLKPVTRVSVIEIQKSVSAHGHIPIRELVGRRRNSEYVKPRQIAMALAVKLTKATLSEIGRRFRRDHTTVIHGVRKLETLIAYVEDSLRPEATLDEWVVQMFRHHDTFIH